MSWQLFECSSHDLGKKVDDQLWFKKYHIVKILCIVVSYGSNYTMQELQGHIYIMPSNTALSSYLPALVQRYDWLGFRQFLEDYSHEEP